MHVSTFGWELDSAVSRPFLIYSTCLHCDTRCLCDNIPLRWRHRAHRWESCCNTPSDGTPAGIPLPQLSLYRCGFGGLLEPVSQE